MRSILLVSVAALTAGFLLHGCMPEAECSEKQAGALPASVRILLPNSHAKLTINGKVIPAKKGSRRFVTPPLEKSKNYTYTFQAEFVRGHKTMTIGRKVKLHAGQKKVVSLRWPGTASTTGRRNGTYGSSSSTPSRTRTSYRRFTPDYAGIDSIYPFRRMTAREDSVND